MGLAPKSRAQNRRTGLAVFRVFAPLYASLARCSASAERFALFHNSAWSFHCARKLACGTPCFIGLTTACFRHWRRPSCAPRRFSPSGLRLRTSLRSVSTIRHGRSASLASSLAALPASLGLLRAASPTGRALRAPLGASAASRPPISRCARRSSTQRLPCARGAVGVSRLRGCRLRGCRLRGCRFHRFRFGLRPSGINQCARIAIWHIHDIASAPYALRPGARLVHQDPHRLSLLRPAPRGQTLRPPPARRRRSSDTDSRSGSWLRTAP